MSAKTFWIILARNYPPQMEEARTAREALKRASCLLPGGFRSAAGIARMDLVRPGPQNRFECMAIGIAAESAGTTRSAGPFTAYIGAPALGGGSR